MKCRGDAGFGDEQPYGGKTELCANPGKYGAEVERLQLEIQTWESPARDDV